MAMIMILVIDNHGVTVHIPSSPSNVRKFVVCIYWILDTTLGFVTPRRSRRCRLQAWFLSFEII